MHRILFAVIVAALTLAPAHAGEKSKPAEMPFRLSDTNHVVVRVKINGKGPFNFVVDTGCPILLVAEPVGKKLGLKPGWATLDRLEFEGGQTQTGVKARIETPFQIEGMNSMKLAGVELHGLMGYTVLAKYRMQMDFTRDRMTWTPLKFEPDPPLRLGGKESSAGMDMMVTLVRVLSFLAGTSAPPAPQPRGYLGFEFAEKDGAVIVERVLAKSPAAAAGLQVGDHLERVGSKTIASSADVLAGARKTAAGKTLRIAVKRGDETHELKLTAGDGL